MGRDLPALEALSEQFRALPGIGRKTAMRLALSVVSRSDEQAQAFACAILEAKAKIRPCERCFHLCEEGVCPICNDPTRDAGLICVVEDTKASSAMARIQAFHGMFHVLGGTISPIDGRGPDQLRIRELIARVEEGGVRELILATGATVEGETTAAYLSRLLHSYPVKVTRLAYGIPVGGDLEYADEMTLYRALDGRREMG